MGAVAYMHGGHKPRCLMQLFASEKPVVKAQPAMAELTTNAKDAKEKKHLTHKNNDAVGQKASH